MIKKHVTFKIVLLVIAVSFLISIGGCGNTASTNSTQSASSLQSESSQEQKQVQPLYTIQILGYGNIENNYKKSDETDTGKIVKDKQTEEVVAKYVQAGHPEQQ